MLSGSAFSERIMPLLDALDGQHDIEDLRQRFPDLVPDVLVALQSRGLIIDAASLDGCTVDDAAIGAAMLEQLPVARERLGSARVLVAGCGPVAGAAIGLSIRAGVRSVRLVDDAVVTAHDVSASPLLLGNSIGRVRADAVDELCRAAGATSVEPGAADDVDALCDVDLVIAEATYAADGVRAAAADGALAVGVPYVVHAQDGLTAMVSPVVQPGGLPCHRCMETRRLSHVRHLPEHLAYLQHRAAERPAPDAFLAAHTAVVAGVLAMRVVHALLAGAESAEADVSWIDCGRGTVRREPVNPVPGCPGCDGAGHAR